MAKKRKTLRDKKLDYVDRYSQLCEEGKRYGFRVATKQRLSNMRKKAST